MFGKLEGWDKRCLWCALFCAFSLGLFIEEKTLSYFFLVLIGFFLIMANNTLVNRIRKALGKSPLKEN